MLLQCAGIANQRLQYAWVLANHFQLPAQRLKHAGASQFCYALGQLSDDQLALTRIHRMLRLLSSWADHEAAPPA